MTALERFDKQPKTLDNYINYLCDYMDEVDDDCLGTQILREFYRLSVDRYTAKYFGSILEYEIVKLKDRFKLNITSPKPYTTFEV